MDCGRSLLSAGIPSSMVDSRRSMLSSDDVAVWSKSQFTVCVEERRVSCSPFSIRCECSWSSVLMPAISWVGM